MSRAPGKRLVLATNNPGKTREIQQLLAGLRWEVISQAQFNVPEVEETGLSFVENALLKARHACQHTGLAALADDSGLVVDALNGAPGLYSARYAGNNASDRQNLEKLLADMGDVAEGQRSAHFQCAVVYLKHPRDPVPLICQASWEGQILLSPRGENGFGYDPLFYVPTHGCSAAELPSEIKNKFSHRGQALAKLLTCLTEPLA